MGGHPVDARGLSRVYVAHAEKTRCLLAGDIRLDNRHRLLRAVQPEVNRLGAITHHLQSDVEQRGNRATAEKASVKRSPREKTDAALILAAYQKWGPECVEKLLGDFSFALWDAGARRLVCARDHAGVRPFFYEANGERIVFASNLPALLEGKSLTPVNRARMGDFLAGIDPSASATFYEGIARLPPAHRLVATPGGTQIQRYWAPAASSTDAFFVPHGEKARGEAVEARTDEEYVEAFRETFGRAVQCRMAHAGRVGTFLSGGLDSTSIAATAHGLQAEDRPIQTFSAVYDRLASCDERPYIRRVLRRGTFESHFISGEMQKPLSALEQLLSVHAEPFFAPNMGVSCLLYDAAHSAGATTILHGHGGDEVVSQGYGRLKELARAGRWMTLAREVRGAAQIGGSTAWPVLFGRYVERYGIQPAAQRHLWARVLRKAVHLVRNRLTRSQPQAAGGMHWAEWVNPDFARAVALEERVDAARRHDPRAAESESARHERLLAGTQQALALETLARTGRAYGVDTTFPFWDKRLVELCLSLPGDLKLRNGWGRYVLRAAMEEGLPSSIQWRRGKTDFFPNLIHGLQREKECLDHLFLDCGGVAEEYLRMPVLQDIHARFTSDPTACDARDVFLLWKAVVLIAWLR
jgi:asparagine synthase (glutamine-hydrolysing)